MKTDRRGLHIVEIVLALGLLAGPLLCMLHLVVTSTGRTQLAVERAAGVLVLYDAMELARAAGAEDMRRLAGSGVASLRKELVQRLAELPPKERADASARGLPLISRLAVALDEDTGVPGLARVSLSIALPGENKIELVRLVRISKPAAPML